MKVTLLQRDILWADPKGNATANEKIIKENPGSDLYLLPEMFSTGFATTPDGIAEKADADGECFTLKWMKKQAKENACAICGSVAVEENGRFYNRLYFVTPDSFRQYDKHHLFTYGGENERYSAGGERRVIVEWRGVKILLQVCYDVRFPVFVRNRLTDSGYNPEYDSIIYVASWPASRVAAWRKLLPARAIENQCYVLAVNRVGKDPACQYIGGTMLMDALGNTVAEAEEGAECAVTAELDMEALARFRSKFPVLKDADRFSVL
ncbi:MAG: nitrilase family protein [Bacteroidales bacterium]|nr:nitrilase family protein [Bacteroidales bacterium]